MELFFEISGDQIDGARDYQEDAFLVTYMDDEDGGDSKASALVIMADGMGGHAAGNIASNLVVSTFNKTFSSGFGDEAIPNLLRMSLERANDALAASIKETPALDGMGCTMVAAVLTKGKAYWISVGDSHLYLIRDRELSKRNEDHSYGGYLDRMKEQGMDVEPEAGLSRNMLMSAMTGEEIAEVDCPEKPLQLLPGDRLIISSDGLDTLKPGAVIQTAAWSPSAKECVSALLKAVEDAKKPRQDNTTVVVVDAAEKSAAAAPPPSPPKREASDTQEMTTAEIHEAIAPRLPTVAKKKRGKGAKLAVAATVLVGLIAAAAWLLLGTESEPPPAPRQAPVAKAPEPAQAPPPPEPSAPPEPSVPPEPTPQPPPPASVEPPEVAPEPPPPVATPEPATPGAVREFRDPLASGGEGPLMVILPGGAFMMGAQTFSGASDELPRHRREIAPFAIGKHEVTIAEYQRFATATGRKMPNLSGLSKDLPMVFVSWEDANAYARWLSRESKQRYRLPSEAEWEYAARAGSTRPYWWGFEVGENNAHCFDCGTGLNPRQPTKVGRFAPNPFGLHDTAGNVMEWTRDCYHVNYNGAPEDGAVWEGGDCSGRVVRGGAYASPGKSLRAAKRAKQPPNQGNDEIGIRLARDP